MAPPLSFRITAVTPYLYKGVMDAVPRAVADLIDVTFKYKKMVVT